MITLTSASSSSVSRGYDYYKNDKVNNVKQLNNRRNLVNQILIDLNEFDYQQCGSCCQFR